MARPYLPQDKQSHIYIEYHRGLNKVLERIRAKYPDVLIQACGGGGGRASYGVLPYFDEFWVSDNTDALQRIYMQWGTSYFYPSNAMAQHISASPNHQTGRIIPIKFRCDVAMSGRLGMELQPSKMTKEEYQQTAQAIKDYKSVRDVIQLGNLYRLVSPYDDKGIASLMYTDDTENKAVFFAYKMEHFNNQVIPRVCLRGLDPSKNYRVRELNVKTGGQPCFLNGKNVLRYPTDEHRYRDAARQRLRQLRTGTHCGVNITSFHTEGFLNLEFVLFSGYKLLFHGTTGKEDEK